jgi:hypothetical protein
LACQDPARRISEGDTQIRASDVGSENKAVSRQGRLGSGAVLYLAWWIDHETLCLVAAGEELMLSSSRPLVSGTM